ncbi:hypothetical protein PCAR4_90054 [Paraburkholderia caribensis]|nr:hypothetical protein PCAR4_90054 [Paraburkholderia caribensis]
MLHPSGARDDDRYVPARSMSIHESGTPRFEPAQQLLAKAERWTDIKPGVMVQDVSTCGAKLVVEFDSLEIESQAS